MPKSLSGLGSDPDTGITAMGILLPYAPGGITTTILTHARLMATTDLAGSLVASLSAPARGIAGIGVAVDTMVAVATTAVDMAESDIAVA
jgi:hypothetical protein